MPVETCLKLQQNFFQREEVRRFIMALRESGLERYQAVNCLIMILFDFAGQEREFRPIGADFGQIMAGVTGWPEFTDLPASALLEALFVSGLLQRETRLGMAGVTFPLFNSSNPHLLPGYENMHQKGARAAQRKREQMLDRDNADAHLQMFERQQVLNLGELSPDITKNEIAAALCLIMRIDRAGGNSVRPSSGYELWMIAAANRFLRTAQVKDADLLCDFLLEARVDPTVPKGAETVLPVIDQLLIRAAG